MKVIKNSCSIILWIGILIVVKLYLLKDAIGWCGENTKEAYGYAQKILFRSTPFWLIFGLLLVVAIILNIHRSKGRIALVIALSILTIIISIWFYCGFSDDIESYIYMLFQLGAPEVGSLLPRYRVQGLFLTISAIVLAGYNIVNAVSKSNGCDINRKCKEKANDKYIAQNYQQAELSMPKNEAEELEKYCTDNGLTKAGFIRDAIKEKMERDSS